MNEVLLKIIDSRQLVSVMNKTKWKELCDSFSESIDFTPSVRYKCITSDEVTGFSLVWWNEMFRESAAFEWLDIDPVKRERRGRLVSDRETDYSDTVIGILKKYNIPYSIEEGCYRVWGYISKNENPDFQ